MKTPPDPDKKILLVDDDKFHRTLLGDFLRNAGYAVIEAEDGEQALALFRDVGADLVLLDVVMTGLDGFETCQALRRLPGGGLVPILMVTGSNDQPSIQRAFDAGASDFFCKPIIFDLLGHRIRYLLRSSEMLARLASAERSLSQAQRLTRLGSWTLTVGKNAFSMSPETGYLLGIEAGREKEYSLSGFLELFPEGDRAAFLGKLRQAIRSRSAFELEHRIRTLQGEPLLVLSKGEVIVSERGQVQVFSSLLDITRLRQQEESLNLLKAAVESLPVGLTIADISGRIVYVNPSEAEMHGYEVGDLIGRKSSELGSNALVSPFETVVFPHGASWRREATNRHRSGEEFPVLLTSVPVNNDAGRLLGMVTVCEDLSERYRDKETIHNLSYYDPVTSLPNRLMLQDNLKNSSRDGRAGGVFALLYLDLDNFKTINETRGYAFGDSLLRAVAARLTGSVRDTDTVGHLGGDEFVILMAGSTNIKGVSALAAKILAAFNEPLLVGDERVFQTLSIGISLYPLDTENVDELLRCAEMALNQAKNSGKKTFSYFSQEIHRQIVERSELERGLRQLLAEDGIGLYFQPQASAADRSLVGFEVLARWHCPYRGGVSPSLFIPVAEDSGLICELGYQVLLGACRQQKRWEESLLKPPRISVNISARQLSEDDFQQRVERVFQETGVDPSGICFEITESMVMEETPHLLGKLLAFRAMGIELVIDDFGTGHSSLVKLKQLPFAKVKIDKSFVSGLAENQEDYQIVRAIILMAHSLDRKVVAEGVETEEQFELLRELGCDEVQGFLVEEFFQSRPALETPWQDYLHKGVTFYELVKGEGRL